MRINEALNRTLKQFDISQRELAMNSGVSESALSRYRRGDKVLQTDTVERVFEALPDEAYHYLLAQLASDRLTTHHCIQLLNLIGKKLETGEVKLSLTVDEAAASDSPLSLLAG